MALTFLLAKAACGQYVALDPEGNLWQVGRVDNAFTCGTLRVTPGIDAKLPCGDATVTKRDPTGTQVLFSTALGGHGDSGGIAIAASSAGNVYIAGYTTAPDFPVTGGALQTKNAGPYASGTSAFRVLPSGDVFIVKLNPDGSVAYSTFLGGSGPDVPSTLFVDNTGSVYVAGSTSSGDFPLTSSPLSKMPSGSFVAKIDPGGQVLNFSTYFPASIAAVAVDSTAAVYLAGSVHGSGLLTTTPGSLQTEFGGGGWDAFAAKIRANGASLIYSTYLGGQGDDFGSALAVDSQGAAWIGGEAYSPKFPGTAGTGGAFLVKLAPDGTTIQTGRRFGPGSPNGRSNTSFVAVDTQDNVYASGQLAQLVGAFSASGFQPTSNAQLDIPCDSIPNFLIEADSDGAQLYASYFRQQGTILRPQGTIFLTSPGHLQVYYDGISALDLTSTPAMNFTCPVNSASYTVPIVPGEIVSLFGYGLGPQTGVAGQPDSDGRYPTSLAGVQVQFNGVPTPLLYVQESLINTVVPKYVNAATIQVSYQGQNAPPLGVSSENANPGVFVVMNQDWTVNSQANPAQSGEILSIFATGLAVPPLPDGQIVPLSPLMPSEPNDSV